MTRIGFVRNCILRRDRPAQIAFAWAMLAVIVATAIRAGFSGWVAGVPFLTYFPTVLIVSILLGWRWGAVVLFACSFVANYLFQPPSMAFTLRPKEIVASAAFLLFGVMVVWAADALRRAVTELDAAARRQADLNLELRHRVNNNLAVVQAMARQTARLTADPKAFFDAFQGRLLALSEAHKVLSGAEWESSPLPQLADAALKPFQGTGRIALDGPACLLPMEACVPLVLCLYELGTNATKYGALSRPEGRVTLTWRVEGAQCRFEWREQGGPEVRPPKRRGLGSRLLARQSGIDEVTLSFEPTGVVCELVVPGAVQIPSSR